MIFRIPLALCLIISFVGAPIAQTQSGLRQPISDLGQQIATKMAGKQNTTIAVVEFADLEGHVTNFGRYLAEELITRLHESGKFKVIERQLLNKIVNEQKLVLTGIVDPASAKKLGKLLGVDAIVSGSISDLGKTVEVNARLISTETGELFSVASTEIVKDDAVCRLMGCSESDKGGSGASRGWKIDSHFFTFDLKKCRLSGSAVICDFIITNNDRDRRLGLSDSVLFDDFGNQASTNRSRIASTMNDFFGKPNVVLISGVATEARIGFDGISQNATKITRLDISWNGDAGEFSIQYRNIPLHEQTAATEGGGNQSSRQTSFQVFPGQQWTDSGIDVEPGMKLNISVTGELKAKVQNKAASDVLGEVLKQRVSLPANERTTGPKALFAKIRLRGGGESRTVAIGEKISLVVADNEYGRLYFGVADKYSRSDGSFEVTVSW